MVAVHRIALLVAVTLVAAGCERASDRPTAGAAAAGSTKAKAAAPPPLPKPPVARYQRDVYGRLADCVADWGFAGKCTPAAADAASHAGAFLGPIYSNALRTESQAAARREAFEQGHLERADEMPSDRSTARIEIKS